VDVCPKCKSNRVHRSKVSGALGRLRNRLTRKVPFRCSTCGWRGWGANRGRRVETVVGRPPNGPDPDLEALDRTLEERRRRS
jgi:uncharacterized protein with PIN domain